MSLSKFALSFFGTQSETVYSHYNFLYSAQRLHCHMPVSLLSIQSKTWLIECWMLNGRKNSNFLNLLYCEVTPWNGTTGDLPLIYVDFKSLVYSGTVDNLYLLDRLLVMYFSTPFLLQNLYWIFRRLPASFIQTVTRSIYFYKKKESRQLSRNIK